VGTRSREPNSFERSCDHEVKWLWAASDNPPELYMNGFGARAKRLSLVMTLKAQRVQTSLLPYKKCCHHGINFDRGEDSNLQQFLF
jgi:hypothetical protein